MSSERASFFNLSSWTRRRSFTDWLVDQLNIGYGVSRGTARALVATHRLVLLLDGLDQVAEVHRAGCVEAINAYRDEHGPAEVAVCCRTQEIERLQPRLRLEEAVMLLPPDDDQVTAYLDHLEQTGASVTDLRAAAAGDSELSELLHSPLVLHTVALAYRGRPPVALEESGTIALRMARLWNVYVTSMFDQRPLSADGYAVERAVGWLAWLAGALRNRDRLASVLRGHNNQSELFYLDRLDPGWIPRRNVTSLIRLVIAVVGVALLAIIPLTMWPIVRVKPIVVFTIGPVVALAAGLPAAFRTRLTVGLLIGALIGLYEGLANRNAVVGVGVGAAITLVVVGFGRSVASAEKLRWSAAKLRADRWAALAVGGAIGLGFGLGVWLRDGPVAGVGLGFVVCLGLMLLFGLESELREERARPTEGIRRSAVHALFVGVAAWLIVTLPIFVERFIVDQHSYGTWGPLSPTAHALVHALTGGLVSGLSVGLLFGLAYGGAAWLQHYTMRASLAVTRAAPWRYEQFLDAMTERGLLRRVGGAYLFIHPLLRDHLASLDKTAIHRIVTDHRG